MHLFIRKREDKAITLPLLEEGNPVNVGLSGLVHNITATVFSAQTETSACYSLVPQSGFDTLEIDPLIDNVIKFKMLGKDTAHFPYGPLTVNVKIWWVDVDFPISSRLQILHCPIGRVVNH